MTDILISLATAIYTLAGAAPIRHEAIIDAPVAEVWAAFTTKEGVESWMVAHGDVDLRVGGLMRTHYDPKGVLGDPNTIENTILSFEPMRMISIRATKPPESFPFKKAVTSMWTVLHFDELGPQRTRVTCVGLGFGEDEESQKLREHFDKGNAWTLEKLSEHFPARKPTSSVEEGGPAPHVRASAKRIDKEVTIAAPLKQVWDAWTTVDGVKSFFAPDANIDLRAGGAYEILFSKDAPAGSRGAEGCHVLSVLPMEMLSFSWSAPPQWPDLRKERTTVVVRFDDLGEKGVRVRLSHCGFGEGSDWDAVQAYFQNAWGVVLGRLEQHFAKEAKG